MMPLSLLDSGCPIRGKQEDIAKEQIKAAETIIKAGKENNVDELEITLEQHSNVGAKIKELAIQEIGIPPMDLGVSKDGKITLKIKYK